MALREITIISRRCTPNLPRRSAAVLDMPVYLRNAGGLLVVMVLVGSPACSTSNFKVGAHSYSAVKYLPETNGDALRVFSSEGSATAINLPFRLGRVVFAPDRRSLYGTNAEGPGLSKVEFNLVRLSPVPGTTGFFIKSFAVSGRQDKVVISGRRSDPDGGGCGVFEVLIPAGDARQVLNSDCRYRWAWDSLSLSPDGEQAVAEVGSNTDHDLHLELIDLAHGITKPISSEFWVGVWSPDGKWIAALGNGNHNLVLIDAHDFSKRRKLGSTSRIKPEWSPDSRYLLLWDHPLRCGIGIDLDPPATLQALDVESGERSMIRSSECKVVFGSTGWVSNDIAR